MKKLIAVIAIIAIVSGALFADALTNNTTKTADTTLTLAVSGVYEVQFTSAAATGSFDGTKLTGVLSGTEVAHDATIYASINANVAAATTVTLTGTVFTAEGSNSKIGYTVKGQDSEVVTVPNTGVAATPVTLTALSKGAGNTIKASQKLTVTLNSTDVAAAAAGSYKATLTLTVTGV